MGGRALDLFGRLMLGTLFCLLAVTLLTVVALSLGIHALPIFVLRWLLTGW